MLSKGEGFAASICTSTESCMLEFDQGCADAAIKQANWDASKVKEKLHRDINAHALSVQDAKLSELMVSYEKQLGQSLSEPVESLFDNAGRDTWASIRKLLTRETEIALSEFSAAISSFGLDRSTVEKMLQDLKDYARNVVERKAREEAGKVLIRMKDRFLTVFSHDNDSMPRVWTGKEDIKTITKDARTASLRAGISSLRGLPCSKAVGEPTGQDLRNPLYLMGLFVVYLLSKAMWVQMDIPGQFQHGTLAGLISISSRFLPTIMNLLRRLAEEAQGHQTAEPPRQQCSLVFQSLKNQSHPNPTDSIPESSVASNISTSDGGIEYSSPNVTHESRKIPEAELS